MPETLSRDEKFLKKFYSHISNTEDQSLLILKAHLLIEEMLRTYLERSVLFPEKLKDSRLEFYQVLKIVSALHPAAHMQWLWDAIERLNRIRNNLAHHLEHPGIDDAIKDLFNFFNTIPPPESKEENFKGVLVQMCAVLYALVWTLEPRKPET